MDTNELEIGVFRPDGGAFQVTLRFRLGAVDREPRIENVGNPFDLAALDEVDGSDEAYGTALFRQLLSTPTLVDYFNRACIESEVGVKALRLRLFIGPTASLLHVLRWERLWDPTRGRPLTGERIHFSRFLSSSDWRPAQLRPRGELRALVVVADPFDLARYGAAPIRREDEFARARAGLDGIPCDEVSGPATLKHMMAKLRDGYDILYLACHGGIDSQTREPRLWFEGENGASAVTSGGEVVAQLSDLTSRPRLIIFASCQSAGDGDEVRSRDSAGVMAAVGPRLAEAGLPAVLAMQGSVTMKTVDAFMATFFKELTRDGYIDRAVSVARQSVADRPDHWMPVLFTRFSDGRIWYTPGESPRTGKQFDAWRALIAEIKAGTCTPILGPGLLDGVIGTTSDIARGWAKEDDPAITTSEQESLPRVTQHLSVYQSLGYPSLKLGDRLETEACKRFDRPGDTVEDEARRRFPANWGSGGTGSAEPSFERLNDVLEIARQRWQVAKKSTATLDPIAQLARLPFRLYLTTSADDQLQRELRKPEVGRDPVVELCRWREDDETAPWPPSRFADEPNFTPQDSMHPLVYHLYGRLSHPDSLVLTEDDYFDYLIGINQGGSQGRTGIPIGVSKMLKRTALVFLGFRMDEWDFRVLFRGILAQGGSRELRRRGPHVAVQIDPEEGRTADPQKVREYLERYFGSAKISFYWGHVEDFVAELGRQWEKDQ